LNTAFSVESVSRPNIVVGIATGCCRIPPVPDSAQNNETTTASAHTLLPNMCLRSAQ
jgi:hypothetical protein